MKEKLSKELKKKLSFKNYWKSLSKSDKFYHVLMGMCLAIGGILVLTYVPFLVQIGLVISIYGGTLLGLAIKYEDDWVKKVKSEHHE